MLIAANFHYIRENFETSHPGIFGVTPTEFEAQIETLGRCGTFVDAADILSAMEGGTQLSERSICVTFDDGLREQYELAWPILRRLGVPALFFVNTRPIAEVVVLNVHKLHMVRTLVPTERLADDLLAFCAEHRVPKDEIDEETISNQYHYDAAPVARFKYSLNFQLPLKLQAKFVDKCFTMYVGDDEAGHSRALYMTREMLVDLGKAAAIGSHSHDHLPLARLPLAQAKQQIRRAKELLEDWGVDDPIGFSYPYGGRTACSETVAALAKAAGHRFAYTMERAGNPDLRSPLFLARYSNSDLPGSTSARWAPETLFDAIPNAVWPGAGQHGITAPSN